MKLDFSSPDEPLNVFTGGTPTIYHARGVAFEIGLFHANTLMSIDNIASVTLDIKNYADRLGANVATKTVSAAAFYLPLTVEEWDAQLMKHLEIPFDDTEINFDMTGAVDYQKLFWFSVHALTTDSPANRLTWGAGKLNVIQDGGATAVGAPPPSSPTYPTFAEGDARWGAGVLKVISENGVTWTSKSENGSWMRIQGVSNEGTRTDDVFPI